jgi:ribonuclease BN (tRNA processing enzyme)
VLLTHAHLDHVLGLAGLFATLDLYRLDKTVEIIGSDETVVVVRRYLADTIGPERVARPWQLREISKSRGRVARPWQLREI